MNAIEDNDFTRTWKALGRSLPKPKAILCISAHWETRGTFVTAMERPKTIRDFGAFPQALFDTQYPAPGSKWLAAETKSVITSNPVGLDEEWGLDHGSWSILKQLYPAADVPVVEMSLDYTKDAQYHYELACQLSTLRKKGVLIIGSGNIVHNFKYANFRSTKENPMALDWAIEANETFKKLISDDDFKSLVNYRHYSTAFQLSAPTPEHYLPMLYAIALRRENESVSYFNDTIIAGAFSMTSLKIDKA